MYSIYNKQVSIRCRKFKTDYPILRFKKQIGKRVVNISYLVRSNGLVDIPICCDIVFLQPICLYNALKI